MAYSILLAIQFASMTPLEVNQDTQDLTHHLTYYSDSEGRLSPEEALENLHLFEPLPEQSTNFGLHPEPLWLAVRLNGKDPSQKYVLAFSYPHLDSVLMTIFDSKGTMVKRRVGGDRLPFKERYRPHRTLNFDMSFGDVREQTVIIRIETQSSMQVGMTLQTLEYYDQVAAQENAGNFLYYGIFLVMIVLNVFWFIMLKDRLYIPYVGYLTFYLAGQMSLNGTLFQYILPTSPELANTLILFSLSFGVGFGTYFCAKFNEVEHFAPRSFKGLRFIYLLSFTTGIASLFLPYRVAVAGVLLLGLTAPIAALGAGVVGLQNNIRAAKFYLIAWGTFVVGCVLFALKTAGILPTHFITEYGMQIGSALEVVLLTLALGDRVRSIIADRDALTQRVARQTASLAQETQKRAKAEQELRETLEEKILLIDDAAHHLNNPLNHISQASELIQKSEAPLREQLRSLLADAGDDAKEIQDFFDAKLDDILSSRDTIERAVERSALTVQLLQHLAQEYQEGVSIFSCSELNELFQKRGLKLNLNAGELASQRLLGQAILVVFALETLAQNYRQPEEGLALEVAKRGEGQSAELTFRFTNAELRSEHQMQKSTDAAKLLLKGFGKVNIAEGFQDPEITFRAES